MKKCKKSFLECEDKSSRCAKQKRNCGKSKFVTKRCQKTCGVCNEFNLITGKPKYYSLFPDDEEDDDNEDDEDFEGDELIDDGTFLVCFK